MESSRQTPLFEVLPEGLVHREDFISEAEEGMLLADIAALDFKPFAFQGWLGNRQTVSFGYRYDFNESRVHEAPPIPDFLLAVRERAAGFARLAPAELAQALVIRYDPGAGIGWHRDRPFFDKVVGISLQSACDLRFRQRVAGKFRRFTLRAAPRSAYLLTGDIRHHWEHSIAPVTERRFSITFRSRNESVRLPQPSSPSSRMEE
jgi:alkylated DNA repair protein (DNA oxidative demethylase)